MQDYTYVRPRLCVKPLDEPVSIDTEYGVKVTSVLTFGPSDTPDGLVAAEKISPRKARYACPLCDENVEVYID